MTVRLQASLQSLVFVALLAATLFGAAGRINFIEFWLYVAIVAVVSGLALAVLDPDLMQERMRPGGRHLGLRFLPIVILMFLHRGDGWPRPRAPASQRHGPARSGSRGTGPVRLVMDRFSVGNASEPVLFIDPANSVGTWPHSDHHRPYRFVRHPGYTAALVATVTSGIALGSWISTFQLHRLSLHVLDHPYAW
jgi:hypothetical protein